LDFLPVLEEYERVTLGDKFPDNMVKKLQYSLTELQEIIHQKNGSGLTRQIVV
jgi:hypothetical protein